MAVVSGSSAAASKGEKARRRGGGRNSVTTPRTRKNLGFVGARHRSWGRWASELRVPRTRERLWIGTFGSPVEAALAYDAAVFCFYGAHIPRIRKINFPDAPRPNISEDVRVGLTVAKIRTIAERYAVSLAGIYTQPPPPPSELPAAAPAPSAIAVEEAPPAPKLEQAVDAASVGVGAAPTTDSGNGSGGNEEYTSFADCLLSFHHYDFDEIMDCVTTE